MGSRLQRHQCLVLFSHLMTTVHRETFSVPDTGGICGLEQHVTGAVALALHQYWLGTGDKQFLKEVYPIFRGIADFWYEITLDSSG